MWEGGLVLGGRDYANPRQQKLSDHVWVLSGVTLPGLIKKNAESMRKANAHHHHHPPPPPSPPPPRRRLRRRRQQQHHHHQQQQRHHHHHHQRRRTESKGWNMLKTPTTQGTVPTLMRFLPGQCHCHSMRLDRWLFKFIQGGTIPSYKLV